MTEPQRGHRAGRPTVATLATTVLTLGGGAAAVAWAAASPPPSASPAPTATASRPAPMAASVADVRAVRALRHRLDLIRRSMPGLLDGMQRLPRATITGAAPSVTATTVTVNIPAAPPAAALAPAPAPPAVHTTTGASGAP